jgi:hypothetical protein
MPQTTEARGWIMAWKHLRSFEVWVPNTSAARVTNTVWWFLHDLCPIDTLLKPDPGIAYPPTKERPCPKEDGSDLFGRAFFEPDLGVCLITGQGPIVRRPLLTRAEVRRSNAANDPTIATGSHHTLIYKQICTGEEHYSSLAEILHWIASGPLLRPPTPPDTVTAPGAPVTTPEYVPATLRYVP